MLCTLNILHRLRGEDKYRRLRSVGASLFRRPVSQGHLSFFFHLSPPFFSTSCTRPLSFITFLVFLSLLLLLLLLLFAVFRHSRFFAKKKRKGTTSLFIERWNTVIIRSRGWRSVAQRHALKACYCSDRREIGSSMADESRGNRQLNVENVLYGW